MTTGRPATPAPGREAAFLSELRSALPDLRLILDPGEVEPYRWDETEYLRPGQPIGVALPTSTAEVASIVRLAAAHRVPLVPRGAGTGLTGGAIGVDGALTVTLTAMDRILRVDPVNRLATVQPGVLNSAICAAVEAEGLFFPPDPASTDICTIGGNVAENAGGLRCVKYGVTRDYVVGLEVVLADGEVIRTGGTAVKDALGYDLTYLFVGSEGTLGIITEITLRLLPAPAAKHTLLAFFPTVPAAGEGVTRITAAGVRPVTLEIMDGFTIRAVASALDMGLDREAAAMLMVESDAGGTAAEAELDAVAGACQAAGATSVVRSGDPAEADRLREARRKAHWSLEQAGVARMEDIAVARSLIPDLLEAIERVGRRQGIRVGVFGHAGDGNFHPTFVMDRDDPDAEARVNAARAAIFEEVLALGGTISGEHGTGVTKRGWLERQRGTRYLGAMRAIKEALDPLGILNPGKVFPEA